MKLGFGGSRPLKDKRIYDLIAAEIDKYQPDTVVTHAEPEGPCRVAQKVCKRKAVPLKVHFLNREKYAKGAWHHRSLHVMQDCDHYIFIHDGKSKGTANEIKLAEKHGKPYTYHLFDDGDDGYFDIDNNELEARIIR